MRMKHGKKILASLALVALALTGCEGENSAAEKEAIKRDNSYTQLAKKQPAEQMTYSPTRNTVNEWVKTWSEPGKLAYIYFLNAEGEAWGYYVLKGLPVSYCAMLTPTYDFEYESGNAWKVPAPGIDGAYYSGGQCNTYYGIDATTGTMVEWTAGMGVSTMTYEEPQSFPGARAMGPTEESDIKQDK